MKWNEKNIEQIRSIYKLEPIKKQEELLKIQNVLNTMQKNLDKIHDLNNEPAFSFSEYLVKEYNVKY